MAAQTEPRSYQGIRQRGLWSSLATGAVIWSLHLVVSYAIVSLACERGLLQTIWGGFLLARWLAIGITILAAAGVLYAGVIAYRNWQQLHRRSAVDAADNGELEGRFRFMALLGVLLNSIFLLAILVSLFPTVFLPLCD
ncbi:MAG: hypothetical protein R3E79_43300 [Caldilineaceae bacterium]